MRVNLSVAEIDALLQHAERSPVKCAWEKATWSDFRRACDRLRDALSLVPQRGAPLDPLVQLLGSLDKPPDRDLIQAELGVTWDELSMTVRRLTAEKVVKLSRSRNAEFIYLTAKGRQMYDAATAS